MGLLKKIKNFLNIDIANFDFNLNKLLCIALDSKGVQSCIVCKDDVGNIFIESLNYKQVIEFEDIEKFIISYVHQHNLYDVPCRLSLAPEHYGIHLLEKPEVPLSDIEESFKWNLYEYIDYPVEKAVVDYIDIGSSSMKEMCYVIESQSSIIKNIENIFIELDIPLLGIYVPEICLRNFLLLEQPCIEGDIVVHISYYNTRILFIKDGKILMLREIEKKMAHFLESDFHIGVDINLDRVSEELSLDIQRSIDYCQSSLRQSPPGRILLAPLNHYVKYFSKKIESILGIEACVLDCKANINFQGVFSDLEIGLNFWAIGLGLEANEFKANG